MDNIYRQLSEGGGFSLPYLVHIFDASRHIYVINDNEDMQHDGHLYKASNFTYSPKNDGGGSLEIELVESNGIIDILESDYSFNVEVVGVLYDGEVSPIRQYKHMQAEATWREKSLQLDLEKDDRLDMTFPALIFNTYNNRGNS